MALETVATVSVRVRRSVLALSLALATGPVAGCKKENAAQVSKPQVAPAELERLADGARQQLQELESPLAALTAQYRSLHEHFDPLPPGLPGFGETRAKFYSAAIGVGTLSAKIPWLTRRIEAAIAAGDATALREVTKDVQHTREEIRQAERVGQELLPQAEPFKRLAEQKADEIRLTGKATCE